VTKMLTIKKNEKKNAKIAVDDDADGDGRLLI
jgi:hypothetical protein